VEVAVGSITDRDILARAAENVAVVYHLAGELHDLDRFYETNVLGTHALLETCRSAGVGTVVHYSSVGVIGPGGRGVVDESTPCRPVGAYARSKYEGEQLARAFGRTHQIRTVVVRPANVFGEGQMGGLLLWMVAIQRRRFRRIGRGAMANYIYAADVAEAGIALAARRDAAGGVFIVSDPCGMDEFIQMMAETLSAGIPAGRLPGPVILGAARVFELAGRLARVQPPLTVARVRALTTRRLYSPARLRELGITPRVGLREGLRRTVAWYREQGLLA
jgi:nucleoside-diphosphate-sugar epimerase